MINIYHIVSVGHKSGWFWIRVAHSHSFSTVFEKTPEADKYVFIVTHMIVGRLHVYFSQDIGLKALNP